MKQLIIVESPHKAKTIQKYLGNDAAVLASKGHVCDLPTRSLGIDVDNGFKPQYIVTPDKEATIKQLSQAVKKYDKVYLATDPDREGEAISWHLKNTLGVQGDKVRIEFNEISPKAVRAAMENPREINMDLVNSQQARRVLDRLVGYSISPLLWEKIKRGLSAGRVQSAALKLICDREDEINAFIPEEYWSLDAYLSANPALKPVCFHYAKDKVKKEELDQVKKEIDGKPFTVSEIKVSEKTKKQPLPFTTSTLQQEAGKKLNFATNKTMRIAQQLYEGVEIKGMGSIGLITYLRTDSTRISEEADKNAKEYIKQQFGENYVGEAKDVKTGKKIQDAHEAIRPTNVELSPVKLKEQLPRDQFRLYQLIYNRFLASRMALAVYENKTVYATAEEHKFKASTSKVVFDGFMSVYSLDEEKEEKTRLTGLEKGTTLTCAELEEKQHFTQPPAHYTEASLVKTMEELGIGRPSTYAPTITTIISRRYVAKEQKNLYVTELGEVVNNIMKQAFPSIVDVNFTATMEALLDGVAEGNVEWKTIVRNFYPDLEKAVSHAEKALEKIKIEDEVTDVVCELCGRNMVIKYGPHGKFLACPGFPECRNPKPYYEKIGVKCPKCGGEIVIKKTQKGRRYYGCENNPECDVMTWQKPSNERCPKCGGMMLEKGSKLVCADNTCGYIEKKEK